VVKTADGTEKTFDLTETAGKDMGKAAGAGAEKGRESNGVLHRREWKEDCPLFRLLASTFKL